MTDAPHHGHPSSVNNATVLRTQDASVGYLHHLTSAHPLTRRIMEWLPCGQPEERNNESDH
jgi:hypothetical protein